MGLDLHVGEPVVLSVIDAMDKVLMIGKYKGGKSVWAQQLAHCVGGGHDFIGFKVPSPKLVLYVAGEGDLDELQDRAKSMSMLLPVNNENIHVWPIPELPFNYPNGQRLLFETVEDLCRRTGQYPRLTIFDPAYSLMVGSMKDDEAVGRFLRVVNLYRAKTGSAVVIVQHTHRTIRIDGDELEEGSEAFFGSMLWKAWAKKVYFVKQGRGKVYEWSAAEFRRRQAFSDPIQLTMVEPTPLALVKRVEGITPTMATVLALLGCAINGLSSQDISHTIESERTTVSHALNGLKQLGLVKEIVIDGVKKWAK